MVTRKTVLDAVNATPPQGTPVEFSLQVLRGLFPDLWMTPEREAKHCDLGMLDHQAPVLALEVMAKGWAVQDRPQWGAFWIGDSLADESASAQCGFVQRVIVNNPDEFLSADSQGYNRRLPAAGKRFFLPPQGKG